MKKNYKIASLACLGLILASQSIQAQRQVIVANGGKFESSAPFTDRATVGSYNISTGTYVPFDTIHVESINGTVIENNHAYVGAFDTLVKYDIDNYTRLASAHAPSVKDIQLAGNMAFVSYFNNAGAPLMKSVNKTTLASEFDFNQLESNVGGVAVVNDSIYIASNILGTVDAFPPYGIFSDTLGVISVFNATTGAFARKIQLDTAAAGINQLVVYNNKINAICKETGNVLEYDPATGTKIYTAVGAKGLIDNYSNILIIETATGLDKYDMDTKTMLNQGFNSSSIAEAYDYINDLYYFTQTDFATYGKTFIHDVTGAVVDSFDVALSPQGIAIDFRFPVSIDKENKNLTSFSIYPNPANDFLMIRTENDVNLLEIVDVTGRIVFNNNSLVKGSHKISLNSFKSGVYFVRLSSDNSIEVERFIKQ